MTDDPKIPYVAWRLGRPRFTPGQSLRDMGFEGKDLKHENGRWMTAGEALDWSIKFSRQLEHERQKARLKGGVKAKPARLAAANTPAMQPSYTVQALFDDWLNIAKNPRMADKAAKTRIDYAQATRVFKNHAPDVWDAEAAALTKQICLGIYDALRLKTSVRTAHGAMTILGMAIQWGMDRGRLTDLHINPAHKLHMKQPEPRIRYASKEEMRVLVATADEMGAQDMGDMFTLAVWSGQRQADRIALTLTSTENGRIIVRQEKTRAIVSIPIAADLAERLAAARKRRAMAEVISPYLILNEEDWKPFNGDRYRRRFADIRAAAAERLPSLATLRDQDFRDTAVTWMATAGVTIPEICAVTGHSFKTVNEVLKHYLAINPELADNAIAKMVTWFNGEKKSSP